MPRTAKSINNKPQDKTEQINDSSLGRNVNVPSKTYKPLQYEMSIVNVKKLSLDLIYIFCCSPAMF